MIEDKDFIVAITNEAMHELLMQMGLISKQTHICAIWTREDRKDVRVSLHNPTGILTETMPTEGAVIPTQQWINAERIRRAME